jgi:hypothetical protein
MRSKITRAAIGLGLDDSAGCLALGGAMDQHFADAFACDDEHWPRVEFPGEFHRRADTASERRESRKFGADLTASGWAPRLAAERV